ncbi:ATP-dependent RNA helicase SrmB [Neptunicella marina]|uniref:ATP-dependent RNA helicase SrmB n=1 Tax=Neptunicella marina TaxID=2125989 RepID=A0A8J6IUJ4_9ALTE|nr:ATP-dependent RNA helicase SrmB [Neptunicella marina]MBC3767635.1 ATP-dependent RNA helicase SrmB [Neptunicella marina]
MFSDLDLDDKLCRATADLGFKTPTSIQQLVIPEAMDGRDILASAPTGTGKTAAFLLPALQFILDYPRRDPGSTRVLILEPTRELALQVFEQAQALTRYTQISCGCITGGINYGSDRDLLQANLDILVATPGRLFEHIEKESFDCRDIEILILDEADRMLDMGFSTVVNQISTEARWRKQSMLFSATLEGGGVAKFSREILKNPVTLEAQSSRKEHAKIHQWIHLADDLNHKYQLLLHILKEQTESAVIFVRTRERLMMLKDKLLSDGIENCYLQGEMPQDKRNMALARFKSGEVKVLIATDVAARGIDVPDVSHVINFDLPYKADVYVHRIGRTGRAGKKGTAISLVEAHDMDIVRKVERYTEQQLRRRIIEQLRPKHKESRPAKAKKKSKAAKVSKKKTTLKKKGARPARPKAPAKKD